MNKKQLQSNFEDLKVSILSGKEVLVEGTLASGKTINLIFNAYDKNNNRIIVKYQNLLGYRYIDDKFVEYLNNDPGSNIKFYEI